MSDCFRREHNTALAMILSCPLADRSRTPSAGAV
jgi:hypothetical protein